MKCYTYTLNLKIATELCGGELIQDCDTCHTSIILLQCMMTAMSCVCSDSMMVDYTAPCYVHIKMNTTDNVRIPEDFICQFTSTCSISL